MYQAKSHYSTPQIFGGLLDSLFQGEFNTEFKTSPAANIFESEKAYEIHLSAPGLNKEDIKVNIDRNILTISYEHKAEEKTQEGKWLRSEFKKASFKRSFTLNDKINTTAINAAYNDGILVLELPKKENAEPTAQQITVK